MSTRFPERVPAARINARNALMVLPSLPMRRPVTAGSHVTLTMLRPGLSC